MKIGEKLFAAVIEDDEGNQSVVECPSVGFLIEKDCSYVVKELEYWKDLGVLERNENYKVVPVKIVKLSFSK